MPEFGFTLTKYDPDRPWIVLSREHQTVTLDDGASFFDWAGEHWPKPEWAVELDPWQLTQAER